MLGKRDRGELVRPSPDENHLDGLARGVADGTVTRGRAIKLAGAALAASALTLFAGQEEADAATLRQRRRRCRRRFEGNGILCTGGGRTVCCDNATTSARRCQRGKCGGA
jgi:hypothetical protein